MLGEHRYIQGNIIEYPFYLGRNQITLPCSEVMWWATNTTVSQTIILKRGAWRLTKTFTICARKMKDNYFYHRWHKSIQTAPIFLSADTHHCSDNCTAWSPKEDQLSLGAVISQNFYFGLGSKLILLHCTTENWDEWKPISLLIPAGSKEEAGEPRSYRNGLNSHIKHFPHKRKLCSRDLWTISQTLLSCKCIEYTTAGLKAR